MEVKELESRLEHKPFDEEEYEINCEMGAMKIRYDFMDSPTGVFALNRISLTEIYSNTDYRNHKFIEPEAEEAILRGNECFRIFTRRKI